MLRSRGSDAMKEAADTAAGRDCGNNLQTATLLENVKHL